MKENYKNILYLECYEGITGEMVLRALRDLAESVKAEEAVKRGKEYRTTEKELLTQIEKLLQKLQIGKITASPVWSDRGPTDTVGLEVASRSEGVCPERFTVQKVGMGKCYVNLSDGTQEEKTLRAMLIKEEPTDELWVLESNIDDCTGETLGYTLDLLFEAGARDAWFTPIFMKKNRPAYKLSVLCEEERIRDLDAILFRETTTIGVRRYRVQRDILKRRFLEARTPDGTIRVKVCELPGGGEKYYPEYEDVKRVARETGKGYREVYEMAQQAVSLDRVRMPGQLHHGSAKQKQGNQVGD